MDTIKALVIDLLTEGNSIDDIAEEISKQINAGIEEFESNQEKENRETYVKETFDYLNYCLKTRTFTEAFVAAAVGAYLANNFPFLDIEELNDAEQRCYDALVETSSEVREALSKEAAPKAKPEEVSDEDFKIIKDFLETILK